MLQLIAESDELVLLQEKRANRRIIQIQDTWIIEDEWWRDPINRQYFSLLLDDGTLRTIFYDHIGKSWYAQEY